MNDGMKEEMTDRSVGVVFCEINDENGWFRFCIDVSYQAKRNLVATLIKKSMSLMFEDRSR